MECDRAAAKRTPGAILNRAPRLSRVASDLLSIGKQKAKTVVEHDPGVSKEMCCESWRGLKNRGKG